MLITESLTDFKEMTELHESLCQEMFDDLNGGNYSPVLRYCYLKELLAYYEEEPFPDYVLQLMIIGWIKHQIRDVQTEVNIQALTLIMEL